MALFRTPVSGGGLLSAALLLTACGMLASCQTLHLTERRLEEPDGWTTDGSTPRRSYAVAEVLNPPLEEVWRYNANAGFGPGSPLITSGIVAVGTRKGEFHMVDVETGKRVGLRGFGSAIEASPVLENGTAYVPVAWGKGGLIAYNLYSGRTLWKRGSPHVEAGLMLSSGRLFVVDTDSRVLALRPRDGEVLWERELDQASAVLAAPVDLGNGYLAVIDERGVVSALNRQDGTLAWTAALGSPVRATPSSAGPSLYVASTRGRLLALDTGTGARQWQFALPDTTVYFSTPAATETEVVVGGSDGLVRSVNAASGALQWTFNADEAVSGAPLITGEVVYVGALDGMLYALDRRTGARLWETKLDGRIKSGLAARNGYLVAVSEPRTVFLFKQAGARYADTK